MFKVNEKYEVNKNFSKCGYIRYSPSEKSTLNTANSQIYFNIPREDSVKSLLNSFLDINFEVVQTASNDRYADGNDIRLVNTGPIASFSNNKLTTSPGKQLEGISQSQIVSLMYKLITGAKDTDDLFIGFDRDHGRRQRELTKNKTQKGKVSSEIYAERCIWFFSISRKRNFWTRLQIYINKKY